MLSPFDCIHRKLYPFQLEYTGSSYFFRGNIRHKAVKILGEAAHSGATDKPYRHDALMAFTDWMQRIDRAWDRWLVNGEDLVFTVGVLKMASSAAISVIPGEVTFSVDIRSLSADTVRRFHDLMQ